MYEDTVARVLALTGGDKSRPAPGAGSKQKQQPGASKGVNSLAAMMGKAGKLNSSVLICSTSLQMPE